MPQVCAPPRRVSLMRKGSDLPEPQVQDAGGDEAGGGPIREARIPSVPLCFSGSDPVATGLSAGCAAGREAEVRYWLMKSEPDDCSIDDLAALPGQAVAWYGVRNYQARNLMRDQMNVGDLVFFYHSSCPEPGIAGIARVASAAYPDATQFDATSRYFDPKSRPEEPRWFNVDVRLVRKTRLVPLAELRATPQLANMRVLARGNRLSITPVDPAEWNFITRRLMDVDLDLET